MDFCFYINVYAVFMVCVCLTKSELCAKWENRVLNGGEVFREIQPCGYLQCWKECKLSKDCADITFGREHLHCGLVRAQTIAPTPVDLSTQLGACATKQCGVNKRCVALTNGAAVCTKTCAGEYFQNRCFFASTSTGSWATGRDQCVLLGGSLATIDSDAVNSFLTTVTSAGVFWVGGNDLETEGTWTWIENDQAIAPSSWWYLGGPQSESDDSDCLGVMASGEWRDVPCNLPATYICQTYLTP